MIQNSDEDPLIPKKKRSFPKKTTNKNSETNPISSEQIQKLLKEALMKNMKDRHRDNELEVDALISTMEEFLRSFIVIGYNMNNEPLVITNAKTQLDADALYTSLSRLFFSINNGGPL
jgi:hypothetical protein